MLDDLMNFAAMTLVDRGRLSFWMPTANDEETILEIPSHPYLERVSVCVQVFNKCQLPVLSFSVFRLSDMHSKGHEGSSPIKEYQTLHIIYQTIQGKEKCRKESPQTT